MLAEINTRYATAAVFFVQRCGFKPDNAMEQASKFSMDGSQLYDLPINVSFHYKPRVFGGPWASDSKVSYKRRKFGEVTRGASMSWLSYSIANLGYQTFRKATRSSACLKLGEK